QTIAGFRGGRELVGAMGGPGPEVAPNAGSRATAKASAAASGGVPSAVPAAARGRTSGTASLVGPRTRLSAKAESLAKSEIQSELRGPSQMVDGNKGLSGHRQCVKRSKFGKHHAFPAQVSGECRSIVEERVTVQIATNGDVVRHARGRDHKRTGAEAVRQGNRTSEKQTVLNVIGWAAIVLVKIVLVRRKAPGT